MSDYVKQRLAEFGALPRKTRKTRTPRSPRVPRAVWLFKGVRPAMPGSPVITCDCHPELQGRANHYVAQNRARSFNGDECSTWFDVRNAFITGYHMALEDLKAKK